MQVVMRWLVTRSCGELGRFAASQLPCCNTFPSLLRAEAKPLHPHRRNFKAYIYRVSRVYRNFMKIGVKKETPATYWLRGFKMEPAVRVELTTNGLQIQKQDHVKH